MLLCENHAKAFERAAMIAETPHTIYEMDDTDTGGYHCHACELKDAVDEMNRPQIIMPGEF
jgi:hypothetical protein